MFKFVVRALGLVAVSYLIVFLSVVALQRKLIFLPVPAGTQTPAQYQVPFEPVSIPIDNNQSILAWWISHGKLEERPTVVYCHGNGGTLSMYGKVSRIFYDLGWNALLFDYRGYGDSSDVNITEETVVADAVAAYTWASERVSEESIIVWGHSLGAAVAARVAALHQPAGLVLEGGFPSLKRIAKERYPFFWIHDFFLFDSFDTAGYLSSRRFPVLHLHAEHDEIIPLHLGDELFSVLAEPKQRIVIRGAGHNDYPNVHLQYDNQIAAIVDSWIK